MKKKAKLSDALHQSAGKKNRILKEPEMPVEVVSILPKRETLVASKDNNLINPSNGSMEKSYTAPSRVGKKSIGSQFDPEVSKQLKHLAVNEDTTLHGLLKEALNDLFEKYRLKPIA